MSKRYMHIYVQTEEDVLFGDAGSDGYDYDLSRKAFVNQVETEAVAAFPEHDVEIIESHNVKFVEGGFDTQDELDAAEMVAGSIVNDAYGSFEWLVNA